MWGNDGARGFTVVRGGVAGLSANADLVCDLEPISLKSEDYYRIESGGRRTRSDPAEGPCHPVPVGSFPEPAETLSDQPQVHLY